MKYGPNTLFVERLIEQIRNATPEQIERVRVAYRSVDGPACDEAYGAAWDVTHDPERYAAWDIAWDLARNPARSAFWHAPWDIAWGALLALLARDRISEEHFSVLYGPWASVFGWPERST